MVPGRLRSATTWLLPDVAFRRLPLRRRFLYSLVPVFLLLLGGEIAARVVKDPLYFGSYRVRRFDLMRSGYPAIYDARLGYTLKPDTVSEHSYGGEFVTVDAEGLRSNGPHERPPGRPIIATGDSFTFGSQVGDTESWPAQLEARLHQPVHNAGVFGFSLGQAVLHAEMLLEKHPAAEWLIVSFIDDDLARCEFRCSYTPIPWFEPKGGSLVLHPPESEGPTPEARSAKAWKDAIGYSALADTVFAHALPLWWCTNIHQRRALPEGAGVEVGRLLVDRVVAECQEHGVRLLILRQGDRAVPGAARVLERARERGALVLDLVTEYQALLATDPALADRWFVDHMTAAGNAWVAQRIAEVIAGASQYEGDPVVPAKR